MAIQNPNIIEEKNLPENLQKIERAPIVAGSTPPGVQNFDPYSSGAISPVLGLPTDLAASQIAGSLPTFRLQPTPASGMATGNAASQSNLLKNPAFVQNVSQTQANTTAISQATNPPGYVTGLSTARAVNKNSDNTLSQIVSLSFTPPAANPNLGNFQAVAIYATGYQGSAQPTLVGQGVASPISFKMSITGETVVLTVQSISSTGIYSAFSGAPTTSVVLNGVTSAPPAPTVSTSLAATPTGYQFTFNFLNGLLADIIGNYRVYRNTSNTTAGATVIKTIAQDTNGSLSSYVVQDNVGSQNTATYYYWISAVNTSGLESSLTAAQAGAIANGGWIIPPQYGTTVVVDNANFEASTVLTAGAPPGWVVDAAVLSYNTATPYAGTQSLKVVSSVTSGGANTAKIWSCKQGDQFYVSAAQKSDGTAFASVILLFFDTTGSFITSGGAYGGTNTSWTIATGTVTAPAGAVTFYARCCDTGGSGNTCYFDQVLVDRMVDPSTTLAAKGNTPFSLSGAFTYSSTTTTVTVSWTSIVLYRNDGTTTSLTNGSQLVTGLSASHIYYVYPYYDDTVGGTAPSFIISGGATGSPAICFNSTGVTQSQAQNLLSRIPLNNGGMAVITPASGSGGGSGGGGGGGGCFTGSCKVKLAPSVSAEAYMRFDQFKEDVWYMIQNDEGCFPARVIVHRNWHEEMIDMGDGELVTFGHHIKFDDDPWASAIKVLPHNPTVDFTGTVYNLEVRTDNPDAHYYVLSNKIKAHNFKPL